MKTQRPKISVIIPVYNVEKYLSQCLDSVINQTLKEIEIICIDDGSTDSSLAILREYQSKDNRIKVITKENSGYGASMNIGLDTAKGEYIGIVESDDFIELNMYETLYQKAIENDCDLMRCQYYFYNSQENTNEICDAPQVLKNIVFCPLEDTTPFLQGPSIWVNIFKKEMIVDNNIKFLETPGASYQDTSFAFKLFASSKRFMIISDALLHYRKDNEKSSVNQNHKTFLVNQEYAEIERFAKEKGIYTKLSKLIPKIKFNCYRWNYERLSKKLKFAFLLRSSSEFRKHFFNKEIDKTMFSSNEYIKLLLVIFLPVVFIARERI